MKTAVMIILYVFGVIFGIGSIGEKDKTQKPYLLTGFALSFLILLITHILWK